MKGTRFFSTYNELRAGDTKTNEKWPLPPEQDADHPVGKTDKN